MFNAKVQEISSFSSAAPLFIVAPKVNNNEQLNNIVLKNIPNSQIFSNKNGAPIQATELDKKFLHSHFEVKVLTVTPSGKTVLKSLKNVKEKDIKEEDRFFIPRRVVRGEHVVGEKELLLGNLPENQQERLRGLEEFEIEGEPDENGQPQIIRIPMADVVILNFEANVFNQLFKSWQDMESKSTQELKESQKNKFNAKSTMNSKVENESNKKPINKNLIILQAVSVLIKAVVENLLNQNAANRKADQRRDQEQQAIDEKNKRHDNLTEDITRWNHQKAQEKSVENQAGVKSQSIAQGEKIERTHNG